MHGTWWKLGLHWWVGVMNQMNNMIHANANLAATNCGHARPGPATRSLCKQTLGEWAWRTGYHLTATGVGTWCPTWTTAVEQDGAVICTPAYVQVPIHSCMVGLVGDVRGRERRLDSIHLRVVGLEPMTHPKTHTVHTYMHACMHKYTMSITSIVIESSCASDGLNSDIIWLSVHARSQLSNHGWLAERAERAQRVKPLSVHVHWDLRYMSVYWGLLNLCTKQGKKLKPSSIDRLLM